MTHRSSWWNESYVLYGCNHRSRGVINREERTCYWEASKPPLLLEGLGLANSCVALDNNRVEDKAVLVTLNLAHHVGLGLGRAVVVDDTQTTLQGHMDSHVVLCDRVHGGGDKGRPERDALSDRRAQSHCRGREANVPRQQKEIIVCETAVDPGVHEVLDGEPIAGLVPLEDFLSHLEVEDRLWCVLRNRTVRGRHVGKLQPKNEVGGDDRKDIFWGRAATITGLDQSAVPPQEKKNENRNSTLKFFLLKTLMTAKSGAWRWAVKPKRKIHVKNKGGARKLQCKSQDLGALRRKMLLGEPFLAP